MSAKYTLRTEASPLAEDQATRDQREAVVQIVATLVEMAKRRPVRSHAPQLKFLPHIEPHRDNTVLLIDGKRGSGKTTVLVTVIDLLNRHADTAPSTRPNDVTAASDLLHASRAEVWIVPLRILDFRPFPANASVWLAVLSAFDDVVRDILDLEPPFGEHTWRAPERSIAEQWQALKRAASIGWSPPQPTTPSGDLYAYESDLLAIDDQRSKLLPAFEGLVDALAKELASVYRRPPPLFVVPIDDLDMTPARVEELADVVRTLMHPRVAFVVTSDRALMQEVMRGVFHDRLGGHKTDRQGAQRYASELAQQYISKVFPDESAHYLGEVAPQERLDFVRRAASSLGLSILEISAEFEQELGRALPGNKRALLSASRLFASDGFSSQHDSTARLRMLTAALLRKHSGDERNHDAGVRRLLTDSVRLSSDGKPRLQIEVSRFRPLLTPTYSWSIKSGTRTLAVAPELEWPIVASAMRYPTRQAGRRWTAELDPATEYVLGEELGSTVWLAVSLCDDPLVQESFGERLASNAPHVSVTHFDLPGGVPLRLYWPVPIWRSIVEFTRFHYRFGALASSADLPPIDVAASFVLSVAAGLGAPTNQEERVTAGGSDWAARIAALDFPDPDSDTRWQAWLRRSLPLLASPESGLHPDDANHVWSWCRRLLSDLTPEDVKLTRVAWVSSSIDPAYAHVVPEIVAENAAYDASRVSIQSSLESPTWVAFVRVLADITGVAGQLYDHHYKRELFERRVSARGREMLLRRAIELSSERTRRGRVGYRYFLHQLWTEFSPEGESIRLDDADGRPGPKPLFVEPALRWTFLEPDVLLMKEPRIIARTVDIIPAVPMSAEALLIYLVAAEHLDRQRGPVERVESMFKEPSERELFAGIVCNNSELGWPIITDLPSSMIERFIVAWNDLVQSTEPQLKITADEQQHRVDALALEWIRVLDPTLPTDEFRLELDEPWQDQAFRTITDALRRGSWSQRELSRLSQAPGVSEAMRGVFARAFKTPERS